MAAEEEAAAEPVLTNCRCCSRTRPQAAQPKARTTSALQARAVEGRERVEVTVLRQGGLISWCAIISARHRPRDIASGLAQQPVNARSA